ncbi:hypothetical protein VB735_07165 [Halotia wernerae UHCC 0503]|nr:hypothetical protein [Halotia wernerae UHCC 0503]
MPLSNSLAWLWSYDSGMIDLNTLIDQNLGWTLNEANAIDKFIVVAPGLRSQ